jgi:transposase
MCYNGVVWRSSMKVNIVKSKNATSLYIAKSIRVNGKSTSVIVEKLGTLDEVREKSGDMNPYEWAKQRAAFLTEQENKDKRDIQLSLSNYKLIEPNVLSTFNVGYLFLQKIFHELKLDQLCDSIVSTSKIDYDLSSILASLVYARILYPSSKLSSFESSKKFLEPQSYDLHQIYRALDVLAENNNLIQQHLYQQSEKVVKRNDRVLYYDCTNFFFEIESANGDKQYGKGKEHRPNPIIQMGLFLDGNGIPLAFDMTPGNTNEQKTLQPLEQRVIRDFELSKLIVCTDAGLCSTNNRKFNSIQSRAYVTIQPLKKLKDYLKEWALDPKGWHLPHTTKDINLDKIDHDTNDAIYYKERWINENGLEERIIVTYSPKYKRYCEKIRNGQIERAIKQIELGRKPGKTKNQNDPRRFIQTNHTTSQGEVAQECNLSLNQELIVYEQRYDGFYGVVTNLEDDVSEIIKINQRRWEIEESFRIMKSEFKARPVYVRNDNRIRAHFLTCFLALTIFRILEKRLKEKYTAETLIKTLRKMDVHHIRGAGYIPLFQRDDLTDHLQSQHNIQLSTEIIDTNRMKKNKRISRNRNITTFGT